MSNAIRRRPDARLIMLLGALAACGPIGTDMYLPSMPAVAESLGTSAAAVQWTLTSFIAGFSLGMLLYGPLSDSLGRRPVLLGGIMLFTVAGAGCFVAPSVDALIVLRFVQALGAGAASVLSRAIARDAHEPTDAAKVLSMVAIVTSVGPLLAPLIGGQILRFAGWRTIFVVLALFGVGCTIAAFLKVPETWPKEKRHSSAIFSSFASYGRILADPIAWGYMLCGGMAFASLLTYITATPFVYIEYFHVSAQHYGLLFGMNILGVMIGNFINTRLVARVGSMRLISAASLVSAVASLCVAFFALTGIGGLWSIVAGLFFVVGVIGLLSANCSTDLMLRYPHNAGAAAALFGAMQLGLGAVASAVVGLLADGTPFGMGVTIAITGALCFVGRRFVLRWHGRPVRGD
ncbi:Bcr/CflA family multidrug efflux MFS transporter [Burkholderia sp. Ac-20379]|uniref:Bcr/CflA family multidrug efflux MFS transporter n=1 Tax=Burkholderia sp. Ac-20379 TaxID=2703900 RepID=UPI00197E3FFF|nr:Bcr/CflA family multidrug efflux MFS transporter [Burkholderia sp. Ac-20379]MBN3726428.1 Bcr/CflA family multidrug efflux MFS transporter [Burkholderia sp. Ac-20379]